MAPMRASSAAYAGPNPYETGFAAAPEQQHQYGAPSIERLASAPPFASYTRSQVFVWEFLIDS